MWINADQHSKAFVQPSCIDRNIGTVLRDEAWKPAWKIFRREVFF